MLAWARPELALWVFFFVCGIWGYSFIRQLQKKSGTGYLLLICSPLFTVFGALPFFLNNYLITKNPLLPPNTLYFSGESSGVTAQSITNLSQGGWGIFGESLLRIIFLKNATPSSDILGDLFGILFHPLNGSMGIFSLTPLFLVMAVMAAILVLSGNLRFSRQEIDTIVVIVFLAFPVFLAYADNLSQLNTSGGITPDIRYLSPLYVPLTLLGIGILQRIQETGKKPFRILTHMLVFSALGIPIALYLTAKAYADPLVAEQLGAPLSDAFSICIYFIAALTMIFLLLDFFSKHSDFIPGLLIPLLCALPFIWQIDISVIYWLFSATRQGYEAWIPITNILFTFFTSPLRI
jgi:hypothetical protein